MLSKCLGVPVIPTNARSGWGLMELMDAVYDVSGDVAAVAPVNISYDEVIENAIAMIQPKI